VADINSSVVKSYDIRGIYPGQLDERFAFLLGRALPAVLDARRAVIGYDARLSSPGLYASLAAGLRDVGAETVGLGLCPTELLYYVVGSGRDFDLGVMVTASHNPPEYNGFKVVRTGAEPVTGATGLKAACELMQTMSVALPSELPAPDRDLAAENDYVDFALGLVPMPSVAELHVVADAGNGVAGSLWKPLSARLGLVPTRLNFEPDGRFPAHHPDPTRRENLEPLVRRVVEDAADVGFCYDGDADRVVAVLPDGHVIDGSEMIVCLVESAFGGAAAGPPPTFGVAQSTCRKALDYFQTRGMAPVMTPVGHSKIKSLMRSQAEMAFAGEDAGHFYYRDFFCSDSALITTLHILRLAADGRLTDIVGSLPGPWYRPAREPSFGFASQVRATEVCRGVALAALDAAPEVLEMTCEKRGGILRRCGLADIEDSDGVRADYADWWFCVRPSGTEPIARLSLEARSEGELAERTDWLSGLFEKLKAD
jgi:phosphomannomutase